MHEVNFDWIPGLHGTSDPIHRRNIFPLLLKGSKPFVPEDKDLTIILVQVFWVDRVVYPVMGRSNNDFFENAHGADVLRMVPKLRKKVEWGYNSNYLGRDA